MDIFINSSVIVAIVALLGSILNSMIVNRKALNNLKRYNMQRQKDLNISANERALLMKSVILILRKLKGDNINGDFDNAINEIDNFLIKHSHPILAKEEF